MPNKPMKGSELKGYVHFSENKEYIRRVKDELHIYWIQNELREDFLASWRHELSSEKECFWKR